jgi:hypothetical protein
LDYGEKKKLSKRNMGKIGITYPAVLSAGLLTGHIWKETGSFAGCHLEHKKCILTDTAIW